MSSGDDPGSFVELLRERAADLSNPPMAFDELLGRLARVVPDIVVAIREYVGAQSFRACVLVPRASPGARVEIVAEPFIISQNDSGIRNDHGADKRSKHLADILHAEDQSGASLRMRAALTQFGHQHRALLLMAIDPGWTSRTLAGAAF